jgi:hypothetical protein
MDEQVRNAALEQLPDDGRDLHEIRPSADDAANYQGVFSSS